MSKIIGDQGKSRYNRNLARQLNEAEELVQKKKGLEKKLKETSPEEIVEEMINIEYGDKTKMDNGMLDRLTELYIKFMGFNSADRHIVLPYNLIGDLKPGKAEIESFAYFLGRHTERDGFCLDTGLFLTAIMQRSESDNFILDFGDVNERGKTLCGVGAYLHDKKVRVVGDTENGLARFAKNCIFYVTRDAYKFIGMGAENCKIFVRRHYYGVSDDINKSCEIYNKRDGVWEKRFPRD